MPTLAHSFAYELTPEPPFDFQLTLRKPAAWSLFTPYERYRNDTIWTATYLQGRLAGIKLASSGTVSRPKIGVRVFLARRATRPQVREMKRELNDAIGASDSLKEFYAMARRDTILRHSIERLRGMHDTSSCTLFSEACLAILLQMAPLKRSDAMMKAFIATYGEVAGFDARGSGRGRRRQRIAGLRAAELARVCGIGYRAKHIVALARRLEKGTFPSVAQLRRMPAEEARNRLLDLPGIGDYSADIINPHGGFPIDSWSVEVFSKLFFGRMAGHTRDAIEKVKREGLRRWGRWAWMAFFYIVQDLRGLSQDLKINLRLQ